MRKCHSLIKKYIREVWTLTEVFKDPKNAEILETWVVYSMLKQPAHIALETQKKKKVTKILFFKLRGFLIYLDLKT